MFLRYEVKILNSYSDSNMANLPPPFALQKASASFHVFLFSAFKFSSMTILGRYGIKKQNFENGLMSMYPFVHALDIQHNNNTKNEINFTWKIEILFTFIRFVDLIKGRLMNITPIQCLLALFVFCIIVLIWTCDCFLRKIIFFYSIQTLFEVFS